MFKDIFELYILKMESIKMTMEVLEKNMSNRINKEVEKYKDAILIDVYFSELLEGKTDQKLEKYVQKYITVNDVCKEEKRVSYRFNRKGDKLNKQKSIDESRKVISRGYYTLTTMYNNLLISILIEFENVMTKIFGKIINRYPSAYLGNTSVSYVEIIKSKDLKEVKKDIIDREVELLMRDNIFKWFKTIEQNHKKTISLENIYMKKFIEAYYRRNIIVHNDSKINNEYIKGIKVVGEDISDEMIGKRILCTDKYINEVINSSIYVIIYLISQISELFRDENDFFNNSIMEFSYEQIKSEEYELAREVCRLLKDNKNLDQQSRIYSLINFWQTYKWTNKYQEVKQDIENFDISAFDDLIKLAVYALRDEYNKIEVLLKREFNKEKQNEDLAMNIEDFPIFKSVRNQQFFKELKENYPDVFAVKSTQIDNENEERKEIVKDYKGDFKINLRNTNNDDIK